MSTICALANLQGTALKFICAANPTPCENFPLCKYTMVAVTIATEISTLNSVGAGGDRGSIGCSRAMVSATKFRSSTRAAVEHAKPFRWFPPSLSAPQARVEISKVFGSYTVYHTRHCTLLLWGRVALLENCLSHIRCCYHSNIPRPYKANCSELTLRYVSCMTCTAVCPNCHRRLQTTTANK